jgi:hypothetical protein
VGHRGGIKYQPPGPGDWVGAWSGSPRNTLEEFGRVIAPVDLGWSSLARPAICSPRYRPSRSWSEPELVEDDQLVAEQAVNHLADGIVSQTAVEGVDEFGGAVVADPMPGVDRGRSKGEE